MEGGRDLGFLRVTAPERGWLSPGLGVGVGVQGTDKVQSDDKNKTRCLDPGRLVYIIVRLLEFSAVNDVGFRITQT